jgi:ubiquitin carboxyl-terminal hydrolase 36/42
VDDQLYDLYGVVIHVGSSTNSGHYYAYCKNFNNSQWFECNDSHISEVKSESEVLHTEAYLLFY